MILRIVCTLTLFVIALASDDDCIFTDRECTCKPKPTGDVCIQYESGEPGSEMCETFACTTGHVCSCDGEQMCDVTDCSANTPTSYKPREPVPTTLGTKLQCEPVSDKKCATPKTPPATTNTNTNACYKFNCAKCGTVLECYINTGNAAVDNSILKVIDDDNELFCARGLFNGNNQVRTACGQQCDQKSGSIGMVGKDWPTCPRPVPGQGSCENGAGKDGDSPAGLSNFASYEACLKDNEVSSVTCSGAKCDSGTCQCQ